MKTHVENLHPSEDEKSTLKQHIASIQFEDYNSKDDSDEWLKAANHWLLNKSIQLKREMQDLLLSFSFTHEVPAMTANKFQIFHSNLQEHMALCIYSLWNNYRTYKCYQISYSITNLFSMLFIFFSISLTNSSDGTCRAFCTSTRNGLPGPSIRT